MVEIAPIAPVAPAPIAPISAPGAETPSTTPPAEIYPTVAQVMRVCPNSDRANVAKYLGLILKAMCEAGLTSRNQLIGVIATIYVETPPFAPIEEYGKGAGKSYAPFYGRGWIQLTHRYNYLSAQEALKIPNLVGNPSQALVPENAARILAWFWKGGSGNNPSRPAESGNWEGVRRAVNGGLNGWDEFKGAVDRGLEVFDKALDPAAIGVYPLDGGYGVGCLDTGGGMNRTIAGGPNALSQGDALMRALGLHRRERQRGYELRTVVSFTSEPGQTSYIKVKLGTTEFNSADGQIKSSPEPYIKGSTTQYSEARFVLVDPKDEYRKDITQETDVEIEIGCVGGESKNVFKGKVWAWSRVPPDGTQIDAVDKSATMAQTGSGVSLSSGIDTAAAAPAAPVVPADPAAAPGAIAPVVDPSAPAAPAGAIAPAPIQPVTAEKTTAPAGGGSEVVDRATGDSAGRSSQDILSNLIQVVGSAINGTLVSNPALDLAKRYGLDFVDSKTASTTNLGSIRVQQSELSEMVDRAAQVGDVVVTRGDRLHQVAPGQAEDSGVVLDYDKNQAIFIRRPRVQKRTGLQLAMSAATTVVGWSPNDKALVGATVVTPGSAPPHPTGTIQVPEWGAVKLGDPIVPGGIYTWGDATKNGTRVPTKAIMGRIASIAVHVEQYTAKVGKGKWRINSWYRDPVANANAGSGSGSRHLQGDAVDVNFPGMNALYQELNNSWPGGVAQKPNVFIHFDTRHEVGGGRARWNY